MGRGRREVEEPRRLVRGEWRATRGLRQRRRGEGRGGGIHRPCCLRIHEEEGRRRARMPPRAAEAPSTYTRGPAVEAGDEATQEGQMSNIHHFRALDQRTGDKPPAWGLCHTRQEAGNRNKLTKAHVMVLVSSTCLMPFTARLLCEQLVSMGIETGAER